jgi:hypothetical protein
MVWGTLIGAAWRQRPRWSAGTRSCRHADSAVGAAAAGLLRRLALGVPIGFVLALSSLVFFMADPSLPMLVYSQQVMAGTDHYVLLAIPFFVLAGLLMEANGMSSRLIELLLRMFGRLRGGLGLITITATAFFSGVSGSKLADIAAVGGIIMPAVRKTRQDPNETAGLLACTAVMAETIPPCINMIIMGFVANISIAGLFMAGLVPAVVMAVSLAAVTIYVGTKINPDEAFDVRTPLAAPAGRRVGGAGDGGHDRQGRHLGHRHLDRGVGLRGGLCAGGGAAGLPRAHLRSVARLFVRSASMAGGILFIVAAASSLSFALTIQQIPQYLSEFMVGFAHSVRQHHVRDAVGAHHDRLRRRAGGRAGAHHLRAAAHAHRAQLGVNPLHFGTVMVIAMGLGPVRAAGRPGAVRHLRHHRHEGEGRGPADDEIPGRAVRYPCACWSWCRLFHCGCPRAWGWPLVPTGQARDNRKDQVSRIQDVAQPGRACPPAPCPTCSTAAATAWPRRRWRAWRPPSAR